MAPRTLFALALAAATFGWGCFRGHDLEEKEPPPGHPGGACVLDDCYDPAECMTDHKVCYDPLDPCKGIYCGGNGSCGLDMTTSRPFCVCDVGYSNATYAYYCTPIGP